MRNMLQPLRLRDDVKQPVESFKPNASIWATAMELAKGDVHRITVISATEVEVHLS